MSKEIRTYTGLKIRAEDGDGFTTPLRLSGYAAKFHTKSHDLGGFRETILPGAFKKAVSNGSSNGATDDVRFLKNHDANYVLGRTKAGTLKLSSDSVGLRFECILPNTQSARDLHESIKRGDMDQCSFAFKVDPNGDEWTGDDEDNSLQLRKLRSVTLFDVSAVVYPAYEDTSVAARGLAAHGGNRHVIIPVKKDYLALEEQATLLLHARNQRKGWEVDDRVHAQRLAEISEENRNATLKEIERLQKRIKHGKFPTLESYVEANKNLQALLAAVGKDAPSPQLS